MLAIETLLLLSVAMTLAAAWGRRRLPGIPYPMLMVVTGLAITLLPGLPAVTVSPAVIKYVLIPPLLYSAAWYTTWTTLGRQSLRVAGLSVGLVVATTAAVGALFHMLRPDLSLAICLLLGAIVAPPDAVAAISPALRSALPARVVGLLEGESLVNDATALVLYKLALGVVLAGAAAASHPAAGSTLGAALGTFAWVILGGAAFGAAVESLLVWMHRRLDDPLLETVLTLQAPYLAFLPAEALGLSGVLATVVAGLLIGRRSAGLFSSALRLQAIAVWNVLVFLLNGFAFVLIGLGVRQVAAVVSTTALGVLALQAALICLAVVGVCVAWVAAAAGIERLGLGLGRSRRAGQAVGTALAAASPLSLGETAVVAWAGMRGAVPLAAALALPLSLPNGDPFPFRDEILLLSFSTIVVTLIAQGLSLPLLVRRLGLDHGEEHTRALVLHAGREAADAVLAALQARRAGAEDPALVEALIGVYSRRRDAHLPASVGAEAPVPGGAARAGAAAMVTRLSDRLHREALAAGWARVIALRDAGVVDDEALHAVLRNLDLDEARLGPVPPARGAA